MNLPESFKFLFKNYDFNTLDTEKHKKLIIKTVLVRGEWEHIEWLFEFYGFDKVKEIFLEDFYGIRELPEPVICLWGLIFLDEKEYQNYEEELSKMTPAERWKQRRIPPQRLDIEIK